LSFNVDDFIAKWESLDASTYEQFVDFHPFDLLMWHKLALVGEEQVRLEQASLESGLFAGLFKSKE
jgi:hypothetical protein